MENDNTPKIRVVVRKRPISKKEGLRSDPDIIEVTPNNQIIVKEAKYSIIIITKPLKDKK